MATRKFRLLRIQMTSLDVDQQWLANKLGHSQSYVSLRLNGKVPWDMQDVYRVCEVLQIPLGQMAAFFPKDGKDQSITLNLTA